MSLLAQVKEAMNDINAAQRLRLAAVEKAEASKITVVKAAEAEAEAKYLQGAGVARQRQVGWELAQCVCTCCCVCMCAPVSLLAWAGGVLLAARAICCLRLAVMPCCRSASRQANASHMVRHWLLGQAAAHASITLVPPSGGSL